MLHRNWLAKNTTLKFLSNPNVMSRSWLRKLQTLNRRPKGVLVSQQRRVAPKVLEPSPRPAPADFIYYVVSKSAIAFELGLCKPLVRGGIVWKMAMGELVVHYIQRFNGQGGL